MAKKKQPKPDALTIPVTYGNVNVGDHIASLTVTIDRRQLSLSKADALVGKRLVGAITAQAGSSNPDQTPIPGFESETTLEGAFDVKRFGFTPKHMTTGLSFSIASIDVSVLCTFAKRAGSITVTDVTDIPEEPKGKPPGEEDEDEE